MTAPRRAAWIAAGAVILVALLVAFVAWQSTDDGASSSSGGSSGGSSFVSDTGAASPPYDGYTKGSLRVGNTTLTVVMADDHTERIQGLRGRSNASPYDGMLFVWPADTRSAFTMAGVRGSLDIGFYDASGKNVGQLLMRPCSGTDATCPLYQIDQPFRYALETASGGLPAGSLSRP